MDSLPKHDEMFIVRAAEEGPIALTYDKKDTTLVLLKCDEEWPILGQNKVRSFKMKVGVAEYDSIQRLHMLAAYTAVPMDPTPSNKLIDVVIVRNPNNPLPVIPGPFSFDTMHFYFVWGNSMRDLYAQSHTCLSPTAQKLIETFYHICSVIHPIKSSICMREGNGKANERFVTMLMHKSTFLYFSITVKYICVIWI